ncbi:hypothetical protein B0I35DRAFT_53044 [Stachybotrys elegans]|uniref:Uncharacterized protein n=1 Tax=Stachybotrys elegans TaxID=80388 RepID=A0A8K0SKM0_9HYPO|nr:hypothetical protein B0I35DRAFT_53044 [Stachybotrys elegans]
MPLQKSYSEHAGTKQQQRSPWQRSHSHPTNLLGKSRPLIPVSEATKNKLSKFQHQHKHADSKATEDLPFAPDNVQAKRSRDDSNATPSTRLTWQDLTEPEDAAEDEVHISPRERIMWDNNDTSHVSTFSPMMHRRGRKRARSSSPVSSPLNDKLNTPVVNVKKLTKALRSPHADPTLELWDRYSLNADSTTPTGIANPALAQLMVSSSPQPLKGSSPQWGDGQLRRTASGGLSWPKRRKLEKTKLGMQSSAEQRDLEAASKSSLVRALLDTVTSSMHDQSHDEEDQDMTSPSPQKKYDAYSANNSREGDRKYSAILQRGDSDPKFNHILQPARPSEDRPKPSLPDQATIDDEFKDLDDTIFDDFDDDLLDSVDLSTIEMPPQATAKPPSTANPAIPQPKPPPAAPMELDVGGLDDFDDDFGEDIDIEAIERAAMQSMQQLKSTPGASKG